MATSTGAFMCLGYCIALSDQRNQISRKGKPISLSCIMYHVL